MHLIGWIRWYAQKDTFQTKIEYTERTIDSIYSLLLKELEKIKDRNYMHLYDNMKSLSNSYKNYYRSESNLILKSDFSIDSIGESKKRHLISLQNHLLFLRATKNNFHVFYLDISVEERFDLLFEKVVSIDNETQLDKDIDKIANETIDDELAIKLIQDMKIKRNYILPENRPDTTKKRINLMYDSLENKCASKKCNDSLILVLKNTRILYDSILKTESLIWLASHHTGRMEWCFYDCYEYRLQDLLNLLGVVKKNVDNIH